MKQLNRLYFVFFISFVCAASLFLFISLFPNAKLWRSQYKIQATFSSLNGLRDGSPVRIAGIKIGQVHDHQLDTNSYQANVTLLIDRNIPIPKDSSISIYTDGIIGSKFINLSPGISDQFLKPGDTLVKTSPGVIIEEIMSQLLLSYGTRS